MTEVGTTEPKRSRGQALTGRLLTSLVGILVLFAIVAWFGRMHAFFELVTNFRCAMLLIACVVTLGAAAARRPKLAAISMAVALVHLISMVPYWTADADALVDDAEIAYVLQYNLFFGNDDYVAVADLINSSPATVVGLHEITDEQWRELEPLLTTHPHTIATPVSEDIGQLGGGMALLSRNPVTEILVDSPSNLPARPILAFETNVLGAPTTVIGLHPHAARFESAKVDLRAEQLTAVSEVAAAAGGPVIVVTDMNITPHSPRYKDFVDDLGWRDPHRIVGWKATWPTFASGLGTPIDHIFISNDFLLHDYNVGPAAGSDHRSLEAMISLVQG